ncbi:putative reverse transcriptase, RNA-dependent DNA polymerase, partial [Tanacetum coccineum]
VGTEESIGACHSSKETGSSQDYILMPLDVGKKDDEGVCKESGIADQEKFENSTQDVNTAGPSINIASTNFNTSSLNINTVRPTVTTASLEATHADIFDDETEVDMSNITTTYPVPSTPYIRIHKDHSLDHVIGDGYTQEEGIDYDEVFAPVARIEAIRLFLAYASLKHFVVYKIDVKSAFLYGKIEQEVYVCQPLGFEDPKFLDRVYKQVHPWMETSKPLLKDAEAKDVDVHLYRLMIGSLVYLTSSRPDIMFVVCACARFQVTPKVSHLHDVKRIFRYLKGQHKLGLWYPKDSPFDSEAYSDSDYAGASLDRKSIIGAEYVAAASCCRQVLWIQNQMLDYGYNFMNTKIFIDNESTICIVKNPVFHSKTKHIKIRHHFIRDSNEKKLIQMIKIYIDQNVADLLTKAFDVGRFQYLIVSIGMLNL